MPAKLMERVVSDLRAWSSAPDPAAGDAALLDAFLARRDEAAFAALVQRHGPMVLGVCRRILGHAHDAEDAFQAVFWVLARKANAVRPRAWVGNWLYGVAVRTALKARGLRNRRREHQVDAMPPQPISPPEPSYDLQDILDEEIERLPSKYRLAVVLCELEGLGRKEAAQQLNIREGTLSSRLAYARRILAKRLSRRGVTFGATNLAAAIAESTAAATIPPALLSSTIQTVSATGTASAAVLFLAKGVMGTMFLCKLKQLVVVVAMLGLVALGVGLGSRQLVAQAAGAQAVGAQQVPTAGGANPTPASPAAVQNEPAVKPAKIDIARPKNSLTGVWRILRIETANHPQEGAGGGAPMAPGGGNPFGARGAATGMTPPGFNLAHFDSQQSDRAYLAIDAERATFTSGNSRLVYRIQIGPGTIDWDLEPAPNAPQSDNLRGIYVLNGNQLSLRFGRQNGPRPKDAKDAEQIWTLMRQPTRQEIYQKLDGLQGTWKAVSGEYNGDAFLPRELVSVQLTIADDRWQMVSPHQPGQLDVVPARFFGKPLRFVLDTDGMRSLAALTLPGPQSEARILYELRGDELKVCWNTRFVSRNNGFGGSVDRFLAETPKEFKTSAGSDLVLFVLKRAKVDSSTDPPALQPGAIGGGNKQAENPAGPPLLKSKVQIRIEGPVGMKVRPIEAKDDKSTPARFTFDKPGTYRFKVSNLANRKGKDYYPTFEILGATSAEDAAFLANSYIPIELADDEFTQADEGGLVTKVYWIANKLDDDAGRIQLARSRAAVANKGTILAIVRLGGIDLQPEEAQAR